ncbi:MAG: hypothetical protein OCC49_13765 [Fibrobacterales bacterium]
MNYQTGEWIETGARFNQTRGIGKLDWPAKASAGGSVIYWAQHLSIGFCCWRKPTMVYLTYLIIILHYWERNEVKNYRCCSMLIG